MNMQEIIQPAPIKKKRETMIDILRGIAVAIMVITHVIAITYRGSDATVINIGLFGGITSFTFFLVLSGISTYLGTLSLSQEEYQLKKGKALQRTLKIIVAYYLIAFVSAFVTLKIFSLPPNASWISGIIEIILLITLPQFAEFLITLAFYSLSVTFLFRFYKFVLRNPLLAILISIASYGIAHFLAYVDLGSNIANNLKALFVGHIYSTGQLHSFPILQYLPIFIFGLFFGKFILNNQTKSLRVRISLIWLVVFGALTFAGSIAFKYLPTQILNPLPDEGRFPPSLTFLTLSLSFTLGVVLVYLLVNNFLPKVVKAYLHFLGVNALKLLVFHSLVLFLFKYLTTNISSPEGSTFLYLTDLVLAYLVVMIISSVLTGFLAKLKTWSLEGKEDSGFTWVFTERAITTFVFVLIFTLVGTTVYTETFVKNIAADTTSIQFKKRLIREEDEWWNHEYKTFRDILVKNTNPGQSMFAGSWAQVKFNHSQALGSKNAFMSDGRDLRVVYFDNTKGEFIVIPFVLENANTDNSIISFKIQKSVQPLTEDNNYFLYYGNPGETEATFSTEKYATAFTDGITLKEENFHGILSKTNKQWFLKKKSAAFQSAALTFEANLIDNEINSGSIVTYSIVGTNKNGRMDPSGDRNYKANIVVSDLEPGAYKIQANVTDSRNNLKIYRSQAISFYVTYPIYVTWTLDWEGWDVGQSDLNDIANIGDTYGMPITHFFNPRIYVKNQYTINKISSDRAKYITNWVLERRNSKYDEIGMHMHMWTDMVAEAGVSAKSYPVIQGTYGVDVPTYAYSREELKKIFNWGRQKFIEYGLGAPISYRTGAWMSGTDVLLAAQDAGFLIDSSGRTGGKVNASIPGSTEVPWSLDITTSPYLPDNNNINTWNNSANQRMRIWEFPNNGADSYWFPSSELIRRFDANYPNKGSIATRPQVITYLSHPHWFVSVDTWKIRGLLNYTSNYLYRDDEGPVVYATLETIYSEWERDKFINGN